MHDLRLTLRSYAAFKATTLIVAIAGLCLQLRGMRHDLISGIRATESALLAARYVATFWISHLYMLAIVAAIVAIVLGLDVLRGFFRQHFGLMASQPSRKRERRSVRRVSFVCTTALILLLVLYFPLLHLEGRTPWLGSLLLLSPACSWLLYACLYPEERRGREVHQALARYEFPHRTFDCAGIGVLSRQAEREVDFYSPYRGRYNPNERWEYVLYGDPEQDARWRGHAHFFELLASFTGVDRGNIRLFNTTTDAIQHAFREIVGTLHVSKQKLRVLTTDSEYSTTSATIESLTGKGATRDCVSIDEHVRAGRTPEFIRDIIVRAARSFKPNAICLSHVLHKTGFVMPVSEILAALSDGGEEEPKTFIIIDGAQAVGQISVDPDSVIRKCHYYATSGHKWLLGKETLGILVTHPCEPEITAALPSPLSLARYLIDEEIHGEQAATINPESRITLSCAIEDLIRAGGSSAIEKHCRILSDAFRARITMVRGARVVPVSSFAGMNMIRVDRVRSLAADLQQRGISVCYGVDNAGEAGWLRVCFHYYHSELDVYDLVSALVASMERDL